LLKKTLIALALTLASAPAMAQDITAHMTVTERSILPAGQFYWNDEFQVSDELYVQVNLATQMAYVFRGELLIGAASVSSGKSDKATPTGSFQILEKDLDHKSNLYSAAPMPYMMRLTWDGIALHTGKNPGYPASHGCVRLPNGFAMALFGIIRKGDVVEVINEAPRFQLALN
jgi:lipoprotein-anchoring transpeptidase ErfK/SrfK